MTDTDPRDDAVRELESEFGDFFHRFRRVMADSAQRLSPGMLPAAYKVFTTIVRTGEVSPSVLADRLLMDRGQLSRTLRELEGLGLITRAPDPADGRSSLLSATKEGRERLRAARAPHGSAMAASVSDWDVADVRQLSRLLHALTNATAP
ncbi:MarR family winged helix-turn-helix transcriptional regulator [Microbacterium sp.]|uniref:MarR family winged helix-turn-helix transcriptional regulator n=1 Tax=Microbacterium sp. TaxID=51671 RepID=UPI003A880040